MDQRKIRFRIRNEASILSWLLQLKGTATNVAGQLKPRKASRTENFPKVSMTLNLQSSVDSIKKLFLSHHFQEAIWFNINIVMLWFSSPSRLESVLTQ